MEWLKLIIIKGASNYILFISVGIALVTFFLLPSCFPDKETAEEETAATVSTVPDEAIGEVNDTVSEPVVEEVVVEEPVVAEAVEVEEVEVLRIVNTNLERLARNFQFSSRVISTPQHSILGERTRPEQLAANEQSIYRILQETSFWNDLSFDSFGLVPAPSSPFRMVTLGEIFSLSSQRYEVQLELEGFDKTYALNAVLLYDNEQLTILLIRNLSPAPAQ